MWVCYEGYAPLVSLHFSFREMIAVFNSNLFKIPFHVISIVNELLRSRDCGVSTAEYGNCAAELRGIKPKEIKRVLRK